MYYHLPDAGEFEFTSQNITSKKKKITRYPTMPLNNMALSATATDSDPTSSDEEAPVPVGGMRIREAYKKMKLRLKAIQLEKKLLDGHELCLREEYNLLKKMYNDMKEEANKAEMLQDTKKKAPPPQPHNKIPPPLTLPPPKNLQMPENEKRTYPLTKKDLKTLASRLPSHKKQYTLHDLKNNCHINITIDLNRQNIYYLTIKNIMIDMRFLMYIYKDIIPLELLRYVLRVIVEKQITGILVGVDEQYKYRGLFEFYREKYPLRGDDDFLEKTLCEIWLGKHNDPVQCDETDDTEESQEKSNKNVTLDDISYAEGVWQIVVTKEKSKLEIDDELSATDEGSEEKTISTQEIKSTEADSTSKGDKKNAEAEEEPGPPEAKIRKICSEVVS